jgi:hypothetical protein
MVLPRVCSHEFFITFLSGSLVPCGQSNMSRSYISLQASEVDPARLEAVMARHLEYERIREFRLRLLPRLGGLVLLTFVLTEGVHVFPLVALLGFGAMAAITSGAALIAEIASRQRLTRELSDLPVRR